MSEYQWEALDPEKYEDLCMVLISRMYPDVRRVEGSGGDGGFDVMVPAAAGPVLYKIRPLARRLTPSIRRSIADALDRASAFEPSSWNLIATLDPTSADLRWFDSISKYRPFQCHWLGRSWLDSQLAKYPDIRNYYLGNAASDVAPLLRKIIREQSAAAAGMKISTEDLRDLASRLNQLDPQYSYGLASESSGPLAVTMWPKYVGAEHDRTPEFNDRLPRSSHGSEKLYTGRYDTENLRHAAYLGTAFEDAPSEVVGGEDVGNIETLGAKLRILSDSGRALAQLPLKVESQGIDNSSATAVLRDVTGAVTLTVKVDRKNRTGHINLEHKSPANEIPGVVLPGLHFINKYRPPNFISLTIGAVDIGPPVAISEPFTDDLGDFIAVVEAMEDVQRASGVYFTLPRHLSDDEAREIFTARKLLRGEEVRSHWSKMKITSTAGALPSLRSSLERGPGTLAVDAELTLNLAGQMIPLGMTRRVMPTFVVAEWPILDEGIDPGAPVDIVLEPGPDRTATTVLLSDGSGEKGLVRFRPAVN
ncbi:hypothetical protein ABZS44_02700 [Micromonospora sediminicola]|uniref:hypothetical protein n=1 Tax=Micromonospora sediminicola TaxID=946078 RepID=UPI0033B98F47